ncbi:hypothetical protein [Bradyrhizobium sp. LMTR 3]|uniref:hypothetical protein n=1 Tax=Bradyrhizobium sp. LMTR 3 TaxID=189873 RepID=UPI000810CEC1|nr:hypothetical protein [Bradyrhizobium sp. LMTR 3]OCK58835.1 hypothetical protein LMTR3_32260 [Bradyrhizobium sp. LMTR 3]
MSAGGAFFDCSPFFVGQVIGIAPLFDLAGEARDLLLIRLWPGQHAIENLFDLLFRSSGPSDCKCSGHSQKLTIGQSGPRMDHATIIVLNIRDSRTVR